MDDRTPEPFDEALDLDALAGDWFADGPDPHYTDLPCYVPLDEDDDFDPFGSEIREHHGTRTPNRSASKEGRRFGKP